MIFLIAIIDELINYEDFYKKYNDALNVYKS